MDIIILLPGLASISIFFLAIYIISRNYYSPINRGWFMFLVISWFWSGASWITVYFGAETSLGPYFQFIRYFALILIPVFFFRFILVFLGYYYKVKRSFYGFSVFYLALNSFALLPALWGFFLKTGISPVAWLDNLLFRGLVFFGFLVVMGSAIYLLSLNRGRLRGIGRKQTTYIITGAVLTFFPATVFLFDEISREYFVLAFFWILNLGVITYSIAKYQLVSIRSIFDKVLLYLYIAFFFYLYFAIAYFLDYLFLGGEFKLSTSVLAIFLSIFFTVIFLPLLHSLQEMYKFRLLSNFNPSKILRELADTFSVTNDLDQLLETLADSFRKILGNNDFGIMVYNYDEDGNTDGSIKYNSSINISYIFNPNSAILNKIKEIKDIISRDALSISDKGIADEMDARKIKLIVPLFYQGRLLGMIFLSNRSEDETYTKADVELIEIMTVQASIAIMNCVFHRELEDVSRNLDERIVRETAGIRNKADTMQKFLFMHNEFLHIASSKLRRPVIEMKQLFGRISEGKEKPKKDIFKDLYKKTARLIDTIDDFLHITDEDEQSSISEPDVGGFELEPVNLEELVRKIAKDKLDEIKEKSLKLNVTITKGMLPIVLGDKKYLEQAFYNLVNNAITYTKKGSISIKIEKKEGRMEIRISDTGVGIPVKDQPKLFAKSFRAKNAEKFNYTGSGLGLYVTRKIIEAHPGGKIYLKSSAINKGSVFLISLPIE